MSFGWSAGDIVSAIALLVKVGQALSTVPEASETHQQTCRFLESTTINLKTLKNVIEDHEHGRTTSQDEEQVRDFRKFCENFKLSVDKLTNKLAESCGIDKKAKGLKDWPLKQLEKLKWKFLDEESVMKLMEDVGRHSSSLHLFLQFQHGQSLSYIAVTMTDLKHMIEKLELNSASSPVPPVTLSPSTVPSHPPSITAQTALHYLLEDESNSLSGKFSQSSRTLKVDGELMNRIRAWLSGRAPPRLWLYGGSYTTVGNVFFEVGRKSNAKIVGYSCRHQWNGKIQDHEARLVDLVYAFLVQLLSQMPEGIAIPEKINDQGWDTLDRTWSTVEIAIGFLRALVEVLPRCIAVVEGFQWLPDSRVEKSLKELVGLFGEVEGDEGEALGRRLLCLTKAKSQMLMDYGQEYFPSLPLERYVNKRGERFEQALLRTEY